MNKKKNDLLTAYEPAEELGIHYNTLYRYAIEGQIPAKKVFKRWWFKKSDIEAIKKSFYE